MLEILRMRASSRLFRLPTGADVNAALSLFNTGPRQVPGVLAMTIADPQLRFDRLVARVVVLVNATATAQAIANPALAGAQLRLHPVLAHSSDLVVRGASFDSARGVFQVPARTTAVFVEARKGR
jgi:pullulanase